MNSMFHLMKMQKIINYEEWSNEEVTSGLTIIKEVEWS